MASCPIDWSGYLVAPQEVFGHWLDHGQLTILMDMYRRQVAVFRWFISLFANKKLIFANDCATLFDVLLCLGSWNGFRCMAADAVFIKYAACLWLCSVYLKSKKYVARCATYCYVSMWRRGKKVWNCEVCWICAEIKKNHLWLRFREWRSLCQGTV